MGKGKQWFVVSIDKIQGHNFSRSASWLAFYYKITNPCVRIESATSSFDPQNSLNDRRDSESTQDEPVWIKPFNNKLHLEKKERNNVAFTVYQITKGSYKRVASTSITLPDKEGTTILRVKDFKDARDIRLDVTVTAEYETCTYKDFKVEEPGPIVNITKIEGFNIPRAWYQFFSPKPYIVASCKKASVRYQQSAASTNLVWENPFSDGFYFDPKESIELSVFDERRLFSRKVASKKIRVPKFEKKSCLDEEFDSNPDGMNLKLNMEVVSDRPHLRIGSDLSPEEKTFQIDRQRRVYEAMKATLNVESRDQLTCESDAPMIAVLGSGGGFRAAIGYSGAMSGLQKSGILDMVTYCAGLSGSAWYLSTLYSHPEWPNKSVEAIAEEELKKSLVTSQKGRSKFWTVFKLLSQLMCKKIQNNNVTLTNVTGEFIGSILLGTRSDSKLTDQKPKLENGNCPMPIYSGIHVKDDTSAFTFHEWLEFTPYEIRMPKYKLNLSPEFFGSKFFMGSQIGNSTEVPLHFLLGIWGSAFCVQLWRLFGWDAKAPTIQEIQDADKAIADQLSRSRYGPSPEEEQAESDKSYIRRLWKSGISFLKDNIPFMNTIRLRSGKVFSFMKDLDISENRDPTEDRGAVAGEQTDGKADPDAHMDRAHGIYQPKEVIKEIDYQLIYEQFSTSEEEMYIVDAGLAFNSPYPPVCHKERHADLIISFDFSARKSDKINEAFQELEKAESWLDVCHCRFPNVQSKLSKILEDAEGGNVAECYIFENKDDPHCPIVMHFILINEAFKTKTLDEDFTIRERREEEIDFGDFQIFEDPNTTYDTFNLQYDEKAYDRLWKLMEFNTVYHKDKIIEMIERCIARKKKAANER